MSHYASDRLLDLMRIDDAVRRELVAARPLVEPRMDAMLDSFYSFVKANSDMADLFPSEDVMARSRAAQKRHWLETLFGGKWGEDYIERVKCIGRTHSNRGITPDYYLAGYAFFMDALIDIVLDAKRKRLREAAAMLKAANRARVHGCGDSVGQLFRPGARETLHGCIR